MIKNLGHLGILATIAGACLIGAFSMSAQAQDSGYAPPHVDTSGQNQQPSYPAAAMANAEQGTVGVDVLVDTSGKASHPKLVKSSGFDDLDDAGIAAVLNWKYVPAMRGGVPSQERMTVGVNFQLPNMVPTSSPQASR
jgi:protein TonB